MKIVALQAENIKKLVAVEIRPDGNVVQITGKNGQGKTSVLDSIWWALCGTANIQGEPIRKGETTARIRLDLGEIVVTRTFKKKDGQDVSTITVENEKGGRFPSPQAMLDSLLGQLSFDPLAFSRMDAKGKFNALKVLVPTVDFDALDNANRADYAKRTELNRYAKEARAAADQITVSTVGSTDPIPEAPLLNAMEQAAKRNADISQRAANRLNLSNKVKELRAKAADMIAEADSIEQKLKGAGELPQPVDVAAVRAELDQAKAHNRDVEQRAKKMGLVERARDYEGQAEKLTAGMAAREDDKQRKIADAKLPVDGISFGDGTVLLNGLPFEQASDAEQLRASIAIAMALNPKLRVIRVRDGSLLDEDSLALVQELADQQDYQVWIERVDSSGKVGFILEDGHLKGAGNGAETAAR